MPAARCARYSSSSIHSGAPAENGSARTPVYPIGPCMVSSEGACQAWFKYHRAPVLLPERNRRDLEEIPAEAREQLTFVWVEDVDQAMAAALEEGEGTRAAA